MCTHDQHGRPHHLGDTLPEFGRRAGFPQAARKPAGLRVRWSGHRCAQLRINARSNPRLLWAKFRGKSSTTSVQQPAHVVPCLLIPSRLSLSYFCALFFFTIKSPRRCVIRALRIACCHNKVSCLRSVSLAVRLHTQEVYNLAASAEHSAPHRFKEACPLLLGLNFGLQAFTV